MNVSMTWIAARTALVAGALLTDTAPPPSTPLPSSFATGAAELALELQHHVPVAMSVEQVLGAMLR